MTEQNDALAWELPTDVFVDDVRVFDDEIPAILPREKNGFGLRASVSTVVVGGDGYPAIDRRSRESVIAADMFAKPCRSCMTPVISPSGRQMRNPIS